MKTILSFLIIALLYSPAVFASSVGIMDKEELKAQLGSQSLIIFDVRTGRDWKTSEFKIQDAIRVHDKDLTVASSYSKDKTFVLYCA